ncbi:MAG: hypothetical protein OHK0046_43760 [Anaerolineae bacterium]
MATRSTRKTYRAFVLLLLALATIPLTTAQESTGLFLTPDEPRTVRLNGQSPALFLFEAQGGDVISLIVRGLEVPEEGETDIVRDTVVEVLSPQNASLAYNDNHRTALPDLLPTDSVIPKLTLDAPGTYMIRVNTYGGIFESDVEVTLRLMDLFETAITTEADRTVIQGALPRHARYVYPFAVEVESRFTITARDLSGHLDPHLLLSDSRGVHIAANDDHNSAETMLNVLDARLTASLPPGDYTLSLTDFLGDSGQFEIVLESHQNP